jgi:hypothetical protein
VFVKRKGAAAFVLVGKLAELFIPFVKSKLQHVCDKERFGAGYRLQKANFRSTVLMINTYTTRAWQEKYSDHEESKYCFSNAWIIYDAHDPAVQPKPSFSGGSKSHVTGDPQKLV